MPVKAHQQIAPGWGGAESAPRCLPQGSVGEKPSAEDLAAALRVRQLFVFCGHGSGAQYLTQGRLRRLPRCSAAFLMGCSSGRLEARGLHEAKGPVLAYLQAGWASAGGPRWLRAIETIYGLRGWRAASPCLACSCGTDRDSRSVGHVSGRATSLHRAESE